MSKPRRCKDCPPDATRDARFPGPRCFTHHRDRLKAVAARQHARHVARTYNLADGEYDRLYAAQGGKCAICRRATGQARRLAVDHNHDTGEVRGLLCGPCNRELIGRYPADALARAIAYLNKPPARDILGANTTERNTQT